jgi:uncharacterized membrane-anchored protein
MPRAIEQFEQHATKVPEVTIVFWIIKIAATTLGETGGDTVTMTLDWGYLVGTAIFFSLLIVLVIRQILAIKFHPYLYWTTIVASTTAGTTMADFADRSLGIGYAGGSLLLFACLMTVLGLWRWSLGSISVASVITPQAEAFYWAAITLHSLKLWGLRSATGSPTIRVSAMTGARSSSRSAWRCWPYFISQRLSRGSSCSGRRSS